MPQRGRIGAGVIFSLIGVVALIIFMIQNTQDIRVHFLVWHFTWSLWILILVAALIGALAWAGGGVVRRYRRGREDRPLPRAESVDPHLPIGVVTTDGSLRVLPTVFLCDQWRLTSRSAANEPTSSVTLFRHGCI